MGRKKEWIWEMQGEVTVADAASSRYRGMISIQFCIRREKMSRWFACIMNKGGTAENIFAPDWNSQGLFLLY